MIKEFILTKLLAAAYKRGKQLLAESGAKIIVSPVDLETSVKYHIGLLENWASTVKFNDLKRAKHTNEIFIELDLFLYPRRVRVDEKENIPAIPLEKVFDDAATSHVVLLGQPGAGKTTSLQHLTELILHTDAFHVDRFSFPILVRCRELTNQNRVSLIDRLCNVIGLRVEFPKGGLAGENNNHKLILEKVAIDILNELKVLLMIDGLDEIPDGNQRRAVVSELTEIALHFNKSVMIVTSRTGDFVYNIDNTVQYEICPLSRSQISDFSTKWLGDTNAASDFLERVYKSPFADTAIRPLTLAHLCAIYERIGNIPEKPKTVYKRIVNLLLEEWDQQRSVKRISRYGDFETDRKFEFLAHLSYVLTVHLEKSSFTQTDLMLAYRMICADYDLNPDDVNRVVAELESHTGLMVQAGYLQYEFAHKSLQEYLAAEYLVKLPSIPGEPTLRKLPNELAIATSISSSPSQYFSELILNRLASRELTLDFVKVLLERLLLEKPDFNNSLELALALLVFYSTYVKSNRSSRRSDPLLAKFKKFIRSATYGNALEIIRSNYEISDKCEGVSGKDLLLLNRISNSDGVSHEFPDEIFIRPCFFD